MQVCFRYPTDETLDTASSTGYGAAAHAKAGGHGICTWESYRAEVTETAFRHAPGAFAPKPVCRDLHTWPTGHLVTGALGHWAHLTTGVQGDGRDRQSSQGAQESRARA